MEKSIIWYIHIKDYISIKFTVIKVMIYIVILHPRYILRLH